MLVTSCTFTDLQPALLHQDLPQVPQGLPSSFPRHPGSSQVTASHINGTLHCTFYPVPCTLQVLRPGSSILSPGLTQVAASPVFVARAGSQAADITIQSHVHGLANHVPQPPATHT